MKFDKNSILGRLMNGVDADTIADEMANALNDAVAEKKKLDAKAEADRRARVERIEKAEKVVDAIADYLDLTSADLAKELREARDKYAKVFDEGMAEMADTVKMLANFSGSFDKDWDNLFSRFLH